MANLFAGPDYLRRLLEQRERMQIPETLDPIERMDPRGGATALGKNELGAGARLYSFLGGHTPDTIEEEEAAGGSIKRGILNALLTVAGGGGVARGLAGGIGTVRRDAQRAKQDELIDKLPPGIQDLYRTFGPQAAFQAMTAQPKMPEYEKGSDGTIYRKTPNGLVPVIRGQPDYDANVEAGLIAEGLPIDTDLSKQPADVRRRVMGRAEEYRRAGAMRVVNEAQPVQEAVDASAVATFEAFHDKRDTYDNMGGIERIIEITNDEDFEKVTGLVGGSLLGEALSRAGAHPEAAALAQEFDVLSGQRTLDILERFTGPKTDYEHKQAEKLASGDRMLTAAQIRAGIKRIKQAYIEELQRWADDVVFYTAKPEVFGLSSDPRRYQRQLEVASEIIGRYGPFKKWSGGASGEEGNEEGDEDIYGAYGLIRPGG